MLDIVKGPRATHPAASSPRYPHLAHYGRIGNWSRIKMILRPLVKMVTIFLVEQLFSHAPRSSRGSAALIQHYE